MSGARLGESNQYTFIRMSFRPMRHPTRVADSFGGLTQEQDCRGTCDVSKYADSTDLGKVRGACLERATPALVHVPKSDVSIAALTGVNWHRLIIFAFPYD